MVTTTRISLYARWLENFAPGFVATVILCETGEEYRDRDLLDQAAPSYRVVRRGWRGADRRVPTLIVIAPSEMLCRDAATLAAPIEQVGEGPTPAAIADFFFKPPGARCPSRPGFPTLPSPSVSVFLRRIDDDGAHLRRVGSASERGSCRRGHPFRQRGSNRCQRLINHHLASHRYAG